MPSPVDALPWGSRSTISTRSPVAASAVPRLMAVVVLPTPPFWFARASTRGIGGRVIMSALSLGGRVDRYSSNYSNLTLCELAQAHDSPAGIGFAGHQLGIDSPRFRGSGQFSLY